jgi:acylphosphatase
LSYNYNVLCIPCRVSGRVQGVIFHFNAKDLIISLTDAII